MGECYWHLNDVVFRLLVIEWMERRGKEVCGWRRWICERKWAWDGREGKDGIWCNDGDGREKEVECDRTDCGLLEV